MVSEAALARVVPPPPGRPDGKAHATDKSTQRCSRRKAALINNLPLIRRAIALAGCFHSRNAWHSRRAKSVVGWNAHL